MVPKISPQEQRRRRTETAARLKALDRLAALPPSSPMGQVVFVWSRIAAALARGHKLKEIWATLNQEGLPLSWPHFKTCAWRIKQMGKKRPQQAEKERETLVELVDGGPGLFEKRSAVREPGTAGSENGDLEGIDEKGRRALAILEKKGPERLI